MHATQLIAYVSGRINTELHILKAWIILKAGYSKNTRGFIDVIVLLLLCLSPGISH